MSEILIALHERLERANKRVDMLEQSLGIANEQMAFLMKELTAPRPITNQDRRSTSIEIIAYLSRKLRDGEDDAGASFDGCCNWLDYRIEKIVEDAIAKANGVPPPPSTGEE